MKGPGGGGERWINVTLALGISLIDDENASIFKYITGLNNKRNGILIFILILNIHSITKGTFHCRRYFLLLFLKIYECKHMIFS